MELQGKDKQELQQDGRVMSLLIRWKSAYSYLKFL